MKFYSIVKEILKPKEHHIVIPINYSDDGSEYYSWLINLSEKELQDLESFYYVTLNFRYCEPRVGFEVPLWDFLKSKHTFIKSKNFSDGLIIGINSFDLDENDLMYIKLLM